MPLSGAIAVIILLVLITVGFALVARIAMHAIHHWWTTPIQPQMQLPMPSVIGPECLVLAFADMFVETTDNPPEYLLSYFTAVPTSDKHVINRKLVEEMLFATFAWLSQEGAIQWSIQPREVDPFSPFPPRDWELHLEPARAFPRTPLARNLEVGYRRALKAWLIHKPGDRTASVEEVIEFALRETRKLMGRAKLQGDVYRDFICYVQHFLSEQGLYEMHEETGFLGRRRLIFKPVTERFEEWRHQAQELKQRMEHFAKDAPQLAEQLRTSVAEGLAAIRQLEPDRESLF